MATVKNIGTPWIHRGVMCDGCRETPIIGNRLKCETCPDHDLCMRCHSKLEEGVGSEKRCKFLTIEVDSSKFYPPFQIRYYACNGCRAAPIQGKRYIHLVIPDYDLCSECFETSTEPADNFLEMEETKINTLCQAHSPTYHFHKQCCQCGQRPICGPRFDSIKHILTGVSGGEDESLCLICFDAKFTKKTIDISDYERVERPEVEYVIHLAMYCCFQCGETPICGPAFVNTRISRESLCLICYQHMDPSRWQYEYKRVEPPCQYGEPPLTTVTSYDGLSQRFEDLTLNHCADDESNVTNYTPDTKTGDDDIDKLNSRLDSAVVEEKPNVRWDDVAGLESAKQALQEAVVFPIKYPHFFEGDRKPWNAFLLYGPPGTGKSYLAKAVATEVNSTFFSISASDLGSKWTGESEKLVSQLFIKARKAAPSIIFIDEIDSIAGTRSENDVTAVKTEILVQMQGVGNKNDKVLVLAATNLPYNLDQAIRRRFDKRIYIPLPDHAARKEMFRIHLKKTPNSLTESDFEDLAARTPGFSGSDISVCVKDVLWTPLRKIQKAKFFRIDKTFWYPCEPYEQGAVQTTMQELEAKNLASKIKLPPIARTDFDKTLAKQRPTVSQDDLKLHHKFTEEFGEEGSATGVEGDGDGERTVQHGSEWSHKQVDLELPILQDKPNVNWVDVAGLDSVKQALREAIVLPVKHPQCFDVNRKRWISYLLYGPRGTGKTYLAEAVGTEVDTFFSISRKLVTGWHGQIEKLVRSIFEKARKSAPSIIFVDDIEVICGQIVISGSYGSEPKNAVITELLTQIQAVRSKNEKILLLAATNAPYTLDPAIRQCFNKCIPIPLPDHPARKEIFKVQLAHTLHWLTDQDFEDFAWRTSGFSGADISVCVKAALLEPARRLETAWFFKQVYSNEPATAGQQVWIPCEQYEAGAYATTFADLVAKGWGNKILPPQFGKADIEIVLARHSPMVSHMELESHHRFIHEFGGG